MAKESSDCTPLLRAVLFSEPFCVGVPQARFSTHGVVLVERTRLSEQYFQGVQKFAVFDLGLALLPVAGQTEASQLITQLVTKPLCRRSFTRRAV